MDLKESIFKNEDPDSLVIKETKIITLPLKKVLKTGSLYLINKKSRHKEVRFIFLLTRNILYYLKEITEREEKTIKFITIAHIRLDWVICEFFEPNSDYCSLNDLLFRLIKDRKQVILKVPNQSEFILWRRILRGLCIQTDFNSIYKVDSLINKSPFSKVYLIKSLSNNKTFACKRFQKEQMKEESYFSSIINEIRVLRKLADFPFFARFREVHETTNSVYIVMDFYDGGCVFKRGVGYDVEDVISIGSQISKALKILKELKIIHRDLKPGNIMLEHKDKPLKENKIRIIDFGLSFFSSEDFCFKGSGTPYYMPLEYRRDITVKPGYDFDMYSVGLILINALLGEKLYLCNDENKTNDISFERKNQMRRLKKSIQINCSLNSLLSS